MVLALLIVLLGGLNYLFLMEKDPTKDENVVQNFVGYKYKYSMNELEVWELN